MYRSKAATANENNVRICSQVKRHADVQVGSLKENRKSSINKTIRFLREQLARYKERRLKFGLFYLTPRTTRMTTVVISHHLNHMPLKEALRRSREEKVHS